MYRFKIEKKYELLKGRKINASALEIGLSREYMTDVLNDRRFCSKLVAYCITKFSNENAEIKDFFDVVKD